MCFQCFRFCWFNATSEEIHLNSNMHIVTTGPFLKGSVLIEQEQNMEKRLTNSSLGLSA